MIIGREAADKYAAQKMGVIEQAYPSASKAALHSRSFNLSDYMSGYADLLSLVGNLSARAVQVADRLDHQDVPPAAAIKGGDGKAEGSAPMIPLLFTARCELYARLHGIENALRRIEQSIGVER